MAVRVAPAISEQYAADKERPATIGPCQPGPVCSTTRTGGGAAWSSRSATSCALPGTFSGLTQKQVASALGISQSDVSRRERGRAPRFTGQALARHAAAVGLKPSIKLWPVGGGVRDEAQARYVARFLARVGSAWKVILEAPIPTPGDLRAVDILLIAGPIRIAVEVITRLADLQAQVRACQLKARDIGATRLVIIVAGTHANRDALRSVRSTLVNSFELDARRVLTDLAAGRDPARDAIITL